MGRPVEPEGFSGHKLRIRVVSIPDFMGRPVELKAEGMAQAVHYVSIPDFMGRPVERNEYRNWL